METQNQVLICPHCSSTDIRRHGITANGTQRYLCKDCKKSFTDQSAVFKRTNIIK